MVSVGELLFMPIGLALAAFVYVLNAVFAPLTNWMVQYCYSSQIVFSTAWEDPRVDQQAVVPRPDDVAMIITSAGCNALSLAIDGVTKVHCVDKNPAQNALLELKIAAIKVFFVIIIYYCLLFILFSFFFVLLFSITHLE